MSLLIKAGVTTHAALTDVSTPHVLADLENAVCSETEADDKIDTALTTRVFPEGDLLDFQYKPATGTSPNAEAINDGNTGNYAAFAVVDRYAEVTFGGIFKLKRWREYGNPLSNAGNRYKIQYFNLPTSTWEDWVTDIVDQADGNWRAMQTETEIHTHKIRWVCATYVGEGRIAELEVIY